jgi:anti-sigma regulatory factor (Ser/Thr protein kinase)
VTEQSQVGEARRIVTALAAEHGLDQKSIDRAALVTTELATNLVKHAAEGCLVVQGLTDQGNLGVEIFSLDRGPGMDVERCRRDGFSTTGTLGTGIGAIERISNTTDILSSTDNGTIVQARIWVDENMAEVGKNIGGLTVPLAGEQLSGDKWLACNVDDSLYCLLVDGLGHGFEAAEAARLACDRFKQNLDLSPSIMLKTLHLALRGSRGAVAGVARIDFKKRQVNFAGLGNITASLMGKLERKYLVSLNGTLGYEARKITEFELPWPNDGLLIMHSDGISSKACEYAETKLLDSAAVLAASVYLHYAKKTDDATVMVAKELI